MDSALLVLALLLCVAASAVIARGLRLPLPLAQIALGAAASMPGSGLKVQLEPHLFLLLFVPPLLFADAWRMPKREFFQMRERIFALAFGLVLFTVAAVGYLLQWLLPAMPMAAAFALAAVLSPTDAVAVSALAGRSGIPKRLMYVLEGEALMNDASGLTAFKFAVAAALTGTFSLMQASMAFVTVSLGGLAIGIVLGWAMAQFNRWLSGWTAVEAQGTIVLILLLPFAAYRIAESAGTSGILAAVAAGMTLRLKSTTADTGADARIATAHIWSMVAYTLNGVIFVLLGTQLPDIWRDALDMTYRQLGVDALLQLLGYAFVTWLALVASRLVWVWALLHVTHFYGRWRGGGGGAMPQRRLLLATALAGVRGAITLAGVLSVPLYLDDGSPFPTRDLMIFIATAVILISLVAASIGLPWLLRNMEVSADEEAQEEQHARLRSCEAAIAAVAAHARRGAAEQGSPQADALAEASTHVIDLYQDRLRELRQDGDERRQHESILALRLIGLRAERAELLRMHRADEINDTVLSALLHEVDMREAGLTPRRPPH